ncbi:MAG TPA: 3,4-dihydroxy-2-butanone-4-phosphate synthase [Methanophagales archaeon]|nr:3,4-dihydroxy-2-butanone-4-phosphate synthase [Methanophagales archaeon]
MNMSNKDIPESVKKGIEYVKKGKLVLIYDAEDREGETDFVVPASSITSQKVAYFRNEAGGLICVAIHSVAAERLGLPLMSDILRNVNSNFSPLRRIVEEKGDLLYDNRSSFSLWVNHRDTFTGITDRDRALTIKRVGEAVDKVLNGNDRSYDFYSEFRTPGHVSILKAADGLMEERRGQTELSVALALLAGISPAMVICEMLDSESGGALSKADAITFASERDVIFMEGKEIIHGYQSITSL